MQDLLDNDHVNFVDLREENILWKGKPIPPSFIPDFKSYSNIEKIRYSFLAIPVLIFILVALFLVGSMISSSTTLFLVAILYAFIHTSFHLYQESRKEKIAYYILKTGVYFQLANWKEEQTGFIPFDNIERINILPMKTGKGNLIIYPKEDVSFTTHDLAKNEPQAFPTFMMIKNVKEVGVLIRKNISFR